MILIHTESAGSLKRTPGSALWWWTQRLHSAHDARSVALDVRCDGTRSRQRRSRDVGRCVRDRRRSSFPKRMTHPAWPRPDG